MSARFEGMRTAIAGMAEWGQRGAGRAGRRLRHAARCPGPVAIGRAPGIGSDPRGWIAWVGWFGWLATMVTGLAAEPVRLVDQHVDLLIRYDAGRTNLLDLVARDDDASPPKSYESTNCVLVAVESARLDLPADLPPLGAIGDPLWVLPSSQQEGLLYLGVSAEGVPPGLYDGPLDLRLTAVDGPGHFFLWQAEFGGLEYWINTRDGLEGDAFSQLAGGHSHANWGFTTSGVYRLTFQAVGRRLGVATNDVSPPRTFTFHVLPLPSVEETPFARWQGRYWPGIEDEGVIGVSADPDGDGRVNLWEYAEGTDPKVRDLPVDRQPRLTVSAAEGAGGRARIEAWRVEEAEGVAYELWTADAMGGVWTRLETPRSTAGPEAGRVTTTLIDPRPVASARVSFYRVEVRLDEQP